MTVVRSHSTFPTGAYSSFDNNGNYTALGASQTLSWDHENRLASISGGTNESYLYDPDGQRVKKSNSTETVYYASQFYEVKNGVAAKYYFFNGARVATRQGSGPLIYLYSDHLGSTVYTTHDGGTFINEQGYYAYGRYRRGGSLPTDHKFTGQKLDGSGLQYFNARYYNPDSGQFLSPDTIVPDPTNLFAWNRYMYTIGNPLKYNDPTGRSSCLAIPPANPFFAMAKTICQAGEMAMQYGPTAVQLAVQWADKLPAVDWLFSNTAEQGANSAGQQNASNSGNSANSGGDPNDLWNRFRNAGLKNQDINELRSASAKNSNFSLDKAYQQLDFFKQNNTQISGHALVEAQADNISPQNILNTFNRVQGYGTQVFESAEPGRLVVWSSVQRLAVVVESSTQKIVTVFNRPTPQTTWTPMNPLQIPSWLQLK